MVVISTYIRLKGSDTEFTEMKNYYDISRTGKWGKV